MNKIADLFHSFKSFYLYEKLVIRKHPTPMTIQLHPQCLLGIQSI